MRNFTLFRLTQSRKENDHTKLHNLNTVQKIFVFYAITSAEDMNYKSLIHSFGR